MGRRPSHTRSRGQPTRRGSSPRVPSPQRSNARGRGSPTWSDEVSPAAGLAGHAMPEREPEPWESGAAGPFLWIEGSAIEMWALGPDHISEGVDAAKAAQPADR